MRREGVSLPWISMMDLLFSLFGALVILMVLISQKLGASTDIDERPYRMLTVQVWSLDPDTSSALARMHVAFEIYGESDGCLFSPTVSVGSCTALGNAPHRFASGADDRTGLTATFFVGDGGGTSPGFIAVPSLRELAILLDSADRNGLLHWRISIKTGNAFWEAPPVAIEVEDIAHRVFAENAIRHDWPLLPAASGDCVATGRQQDCNRLWIDSDGIHFKD
ncbi:MAG: hypothetical protein OXJ64_00260 [Boseongicola sp.]|nr:hypothetical protein [Boseongicola sp.]